METQTTTAATTPTTGQQTTATAPTETDTGSGTLSSDFDTFLQLLTAQLRNQDPLAPADSTEWVSQLADFATVEQQTITNNLLREQNASATESSLNELANWIDRSVATKGALRYDGFAEFEVDLDPQGAEDRFEIVVFDDNGNEVRRDEVENYAGVGSWPPASTSLGAGEYYLKVSAYDGETFQRSFEPTIYKEVVQVSLAGDEPLLVLEDTSSIKESDISVFR
ncbi:MAG: flagellar hook capping FlgD N-terminal domain-containing protein [Pseudomonadota bacterium]